MMKASVVSILVVAIPARRWSGSQGAAAEDSPSHRVS